VYWHVPETRANLERLAERRRVVQYDGRGYGLSDRAITDFSLEARLGDLAAVVASLDAPEVDLLAIAQAGPVAIRYAAAHPDQISRLVLADTVARGGDVVRGPRQRALRHLLEVDWELWVRTQVLVLFDWTEMGRKVAELAVGDVAPDVFLAAMRTARSDDVTDILPLVQCPTLVLQGRAAQIVSLNTSRQLAAAIPGARFAIYESTHALVLGEVLSVQAMEAFLDEDAGEAVAETFLGSGTALILFADIADSTALTERLGDAAFREGARELDRTLRSVIRENAGTPIEGKLLGDGVLAVFTSAREAIQTAVCCAAAGASAGMPLHVGLHAGDVIREDGNVYGGAVNIAARIAGLSPPGEVLVSETVRSLARTSAGVHFDDRGEQALKGVGEAVRVWAVGAGT
jgi:class 3 adenylate cyclase